MSARRGGSDERIEPPLSAVEEPARGAADAGARAMDRAAESAAAALARELSFPVASLDLNRDADPALRAEDPAPRPVRAPSRPDLSSEPSRINRHAEALGGRASGVDSRAMTPETPHGSTTRAPRREKWRARMRILGGFATFAFFSFFALCLFVYGVFWWHGRDLPSTAQLAEYQPATLSRVYSGDGALLAEFARERRLYTPIAEIPPLIRHAFISAEDKNFYRHDGIDNIGVVKAMVDNVMRVLAGRRLRGASTITQQVVKNFLLDGDRQISRKIREVLLAWRLESVLTKDQILELYLNEIFLGQGSYGVTSAAMRYFGRRLEDLTVAQAAFLAALPKAPSTYHPVRRRELATRRRNYVLREMLENGYIDQAQYDEAIATPLTTLLDEDEESRIALGRTLTQRPPPIGYFGEEIRRELIAQYGEEQVYAGGFTVRATVDPELQALAGRVLQTRLWEFSRERGYSGPFARIDPEAVSLEDPEAWRPALDAVEGPEDVLDWRRAVVLEVTESGARVGVHEWENEEPIEVPFSDVRDWARRREGYEDNGEIVFGPRPRGPADVWAPGDVIFVAPVRDDAGEITGWSMRQAPDVNGALVALDPRTGRVLAMQGGFSYDQSVFNRATQAERQPGSAIKPFVYAAALEAGYQPNSIILDAPVTLPQGSGETWRPRNYSGRFYGPSPLRWGIERSHNLMTVRLAIDVGLDRVADYTQRLGVYEQMPLLYSYALGSGETTLMRLTASYAMFVNGGREIRPTLIDRVQDRHGRTIFRHDARICTGCSGVEWAGQPEPYIADTGAQLLDPVTAYQLVSMMQGVTTRGTASQVGRALGFPVAGKTGTTNEARDAWFVGFTPEIVVGCYIGFDQPRPMGREASGGALCAPVFEAFMREAVGSGPYPEFRRPAGVQMVRVHRTTGCAVTANTRGADFIWEAFRADTAPRVGECPPNDFAFGNTEASGGTGVDLNELDQLLSEGGGQSEIRRPGENPPAPVEGDGSIRRGGETGGGAARDLASERGAPRRPPPPPQGGGDLGGIF